MVVTIASFLFTYIAFSIGRVPGLRSDRVAAAIIGGVILIAAGVLSVPEAQAAVDGSTLALLFGMMVLSAALDLSGAFAVVGWWVSRHARGPLGLMVAIALASAVLSAFLINDVVCIAFTPLVLHIASSVRRDPKPYLLALATSSNIGSVATVTGNPQNILIASLSHVSYGHFAAVLGPIAGAALVGNVAVVWLVHHRDMGGAFIVSPDGEKPTLHRRLAWKSGLVMAGVLAAFAAGVPPVVASLLGAAVMMLTRATDPKRLYVRVDWTLLALFAGLFVVVAGVEKSGLAQTLLRILRPLHPDSVVGLTAITAVLSNLVSNVAAVMMLKSLVPRLPDPQSAWFTLAMASTLAGNLTLPGSLATVIVAERAKGSASISFLDFLKVGTPSALISLAIGATWLAFVR